MTGGDYGAGIGSGLGESGAPCNGKVTIKDNAKIGLAQAVLVPQASAAVTIIVMDMTMMIPPPVWVM